VKQNPNRFQPLLCSVLFCLSPGGTVRFGDGDLSPGLLQRVFGTFPSGVTAVCGLVDGEPRGLTASSFTSVSLKPALVSVCMDNGSRTWPRLRRLSRIGISILSSGQGGVCRQLASDAGDRFSGVAWTATEDGAVFLDEAAAWLDCAPVQEVAAGDHHIVLFDVQAVAHDPQIAPLVFHASRLRDLTG
jgi:flavin reductase (DIM6/NTAB) family NADH-FMN oxidoreductase RutF